MARRPARRIVLALTALALLAFFVPPLVNVNRFRARIATSMSNALGRKVSVGGVALRLLPQPGFDLRRVVIADDPSFGAEPMLRADEVTAALRLGGLWRGRLEIAKLSLKSGANISPPSLNLVRAADGRWNIEALLQRASEMPTAPTAQLRADARPRFPYIEADGGRINFKIGQEKKVYALTDADFALWLASEDEWAFRLTARPVRTDFNLSDTGVLKLNGRFHRAPSLHETPVELNVAAQNAQLGQLTKLIYGRDRGWRGSVDVDAHLLGTPAGLNITVQAGVRELRRYDINTAESLRLDMRCRAKYSTATQQLWDVECRLPAGDGVVLARGSLSPLLQPANVELSLAAEDVPLQSLVTLARHSKENIPDDLSASGTLDGILTYHRTAVDSAAHWTGSVNTSDAVLRSAVLQPQMQLPPLSFTLEGPGAEYQPGAAGKPGRRVAPSRPAGSVLRLAAKPFAAPLGTTNPATVTGWFSAKRYEWHLQGDARIARLLQLGRVLGLRAPAFSDEGIAHVDLQVAGQWSGFARPVITGNAQVRNLNASLAGFNAPLHISSASVSLTPDAAILQNFVAIFPGSPVQFAGSVQVARACETLEQCPVRFALHSDQVGLDGLNRLLNPRHAKHAWYQMFAAEPRAPLLARLQASGQISISRLVLRSVVATHVSAAVQLRGGKLVLGDLSGELLGGKHRGQWQADFSGAAPQYTGAGTFDGIAMPQLATLMRDNWAAGKASVTYRVTLAGSSAPELAASANGAGSFDWQNGALPHVALDGHSGPLHFKRFTGQMELREGTLLLAKSKMTAASGIYTVSGTASFGRELSLKLRNGGRAYDVSGPLDKPKVTLVAGSTEAALKP